MIMTHRVTVNDDEDAEIDVFSVSDDEVEPKYEPIVITKDEDRPQYVPSPILDELHPLWDNMELSFSTTKPSTDSDESDYDSSDEAEERTLKEREYWEKVERRMFQDAAEKKQQEAANKWILSSRRSTEQLKKEKEFEKFINQDIFDPSPEYLMKNIEELSQSELEELTEITRQVQKPTLHTPSFKMAEEPDGFDPVISLKFFKKFCDGYIKYDDEKEPEIKRRRGMGLNCLSFFWQIQER